MTNDLEDASSFNAELMANISELEDQLHQLHTDQIFTSTPFRRDSHALSLLEEIEDQANEVKHKVTIENMVETMENGVESLGELSPGTESFRQHVDKRVS